MTSNGLQGFAGVSVDPLAAARNRVAEAGGLVGSPRVFEALANDHLEAEKIRAGSSSGGSKAAAAKVPRDIEAEMQIAAMVDARAKHLIDTSVVHTAQGPRPLSSDDAYRLAQMDVQQQLRYGDQLQKPEQAGAGPMQEFSIF